MPPERVVANPFSPNFVLDVSANDGMHLLRQCVTEAKQGVSYRWTPRDAPLSTGFGLQCLILVRRPTHV